MSKNVLKMTLNQHFPKKFKIRYDIIRPGSGRKVAGKTFP